MKHLLLLTLLVAFLSSTAQVIIPQASVWKYLDDGSDQGTAWYSQTFNDSSWAQGAAQLGYGDGDETTVLSYGSSSSNKYLTYYFRKTFTPQNTNNQEWVKLELLRDDGAVVYLNGTELIRSNMPTGTITYTTKAAHTVAGSDEDYFNQYFFPDSLLISGQNIIAVEVHQRTASSSDMSFDLKLSYTNLTIFRKAPYLLYTGNNDEMLILWQLREQKDCAFHWGTDTTYNLGQNNSQEINTEHQHKILLNGLTPNTKYYYKVVYDSTNIKKGSFVTGAIDNAQDLTFYAYGDTRTQADKHNEVANAIMNDMASDNNAQTFIVSSGDMVANGDQEEDWDQQFFDEQYSHLQELLANLPYLAAVGNHEGQGDLFAKYFPYPMFVNGKYYYSFDYGPVHFTVIDQYDNYSSGSDQYNWIVNDLATNNKAWKIILLHKSAWSAGGGHSNSSSVQTLIHPLCLQYGVQFVIAGHNHYYARAIANNIQYITTGGGGAPLYTPEANSDSIVKVDKSYHFCKLQIQDDSLTFSAIRSNGSIIEEIKTSRNDVTSIKSQKNNLFSNIQLWSSGKSVFIKSEKVLNGNIEIFDAIGRTVLSQKLNKNTTHIKLKQSGIYLIRVSNGNNIFVKKVIVE